MTQNKIRKSTLRAFEKDLLIRYATFAQRSRKKAILVKVAEDYFVTNSFSTNGHKPTIIFFSDVQELVCIPDDPNWHNVEKETIKDLIKKAKELYNNVFMLNVQDRRRYLNKSLIEFKRYSPASIDEGKFLSSIKDLMDLLPI